MKKLLVKLAGNENWGKLVYIWDRKRADELLEQAGRALGMTVKEIKDSKAYAEFEDELQEYADELDY